MFPASEYPERCTIRAAPISQEQSRPAQLSSSQDRWSSKVIPYGMVNHNCHRQLFEQGGSTWGLAYVPGPDSGITPGLGPYTHHGAGQPVPSNSSLHGLSPAQLSFSSPQMFDPPQRYGGISMISYGRDQSFGVSQPTGQCNNTYVTWPTTAD